MGLSLAVGMLADVAECDEDAAGEYESYFAKVNRLLAEHGLPPHREPRDVEPWSADMVGYSGLHYLRRLAAYVDSGVELPPPGDSDASKDQRLEAYFQHVVAGSPSSTLGRLFRKGPSFRREFDHLIVHSDAEGFYLPTDFPNVLIADDETPVPGQMVGSTPRLLAECERLARVLQIPPDIDCGSEELWEASDAQGEGDVLWKRYGVESFTCVVLREACRRSMATGAAIVFC